MEQVPRKTKGTSWYALIIRIVLGVVFIAYGSQKMFDDLDGQSLSDVELVQLADMGLIAKDATDKKKAVDKAQLPELYRTGLVILNSENLSNLAKDGIPQKRFVESLRENAKVLSWVAGLTEFLGGCCLLIGLLTRIWALGMLGMMVMAGFLKFWNPEVGVNIFDPGWSVFNGGLEYVFVLGMLCFAVVFGGPGKISFDRMIFRRKKYEPLSPNSARTGGAQGGIPPKPAAENTPRIISQSLPGHVEMPPPIMPTNPSKSVPSGSPKIAGTTGGNSASGTRSRTGSGSGSSTPAPTPPGANGNGSGTGSYGMRRPSRKEEEPPTRPI